MELYGILLHIKETPYRSSVPVFFDANENVFCFAQPVRLRFHRSFFSCARILPAQKEGSVTKYFKKGFTLVELMVVLGIMAILFGIAIPGLSAYIHLSQFRRNDSYAKTMYLAAESSLTYHRTGGDWEDLALDIEQQGTQSFPDDDEKQSIYALRLDPGEYGEETKSGDGALVTELLDTDIYDKSMLDAAICLEIDITSGQIYSVFYGTNCDGLYYSHEGGDHVGQLCIDGDKRDYDTRKAERLGYYSVEDTANMADLKPVRLKITSLNLLNDEALTLNWASNSKHQDLDVEYTINFYKKGDSSSPLMTISGLRLADLHGSTAPLLDVKLKSSTETSKYVFPLRYETGRFTLTLDAMMNADLTETLRQHPGWVPENSTSITRFAGFNTPMDIYATVKASPTYENMGDDASEYRESAETKSNEANTMFADNSTADKAGITAFRHLSNIRYINNASEFTVSTRTLDWNSSNVTVYGITTTQTPEGATGSSLTVQSAPAFPTVPELRVDQSLDGSGGLLGKAVALLTGSNTIEGVKLDNTSTPSEPSNGQPKYLGLFAQNHGTISGLRMANAQLAVENGSYLGAGAVCGLSDGVLKSVSVAESSSIRASLTDTANQPHGIGGVVGVLKVAGSNKATGLFADGSVSGVLPAGQVSGGIGGIAGYADIAEDASLTGSENRASVTGNRSVGGIAGYAAAHSDAHGGASGAAAAHFRDALEGLRLAVLRGRKRAVAPVGERRLPLRRPQPHFQRAGHGGLRHRGHAKRFRYASVPVRPTRRGHHRRLLGRLRQG